MERLGLSRGQQTQIEPCLGLLRPPRQARWVNWGDRSIALASIVVLCAAAAWGQSEFDGTPVPDQALEGGVEWINTSDPISLAQLRGKFVLLDFWTYCCINCLQTLPDIQALEQAYPHQLVVIGVHAPKFFGERDSANIREAVLRHHISHPVVNDANAVIARNFGVTGWPSLRLIDPQGKLVASHNGETTFETMQAYMRRAVPRYRQKRLLDETPIAFALERYRQPAQQLNFPGKLLVDSTAGRLFVADSGHHRVVMLSLDGEWIGTIGSGTAGLRDGAWDTAEFSNPQGLALRGDKLFVADTDNHALRLVDLTQKQVSTLAGNGQQAMLRPDFRATSQPKAVRLASPWDLLIQEDELYIAMAGTHQIWKMLLGRGRLQVFAGNVKEDVVDGPHLVNPNSNQLSSSFAQPSGLASDGKFLYVADSEGSSIRQVSLGGTGGVATLLGTSGLPEAARLFTFGDRDGALNQALLQHPLAVAYGRDMLYVADTYNNRIKAIDLVRGEIQTLAGDGTAGSSDSPARFNEPAGLALAGDWLYVADTNNHQVRKINLAQGNGQTTTVKIRGLKAFRPPSRTPPPPAKGDAMPFPTARLAPADGNITIQVQLAFPPQSAINPAAPMSYAVSQVSGDPIFGPSVDGKRVTVKKPSERLTLRIPVQQSTGSARVGLEVAYFYCQKDASALCKIGASRWEGAIELTETGEAVLALKHSLD